MGIDPAPFWANLNLYVHESKFISTLYSNKDYSCFKFNGTKRFIDDLIAINDDGQFSIIYSEIYPEELELKIEYQGSHATFLDLDITICDGRFIYKLFDKRDNFYFFIVRMPHFDSNIPSSIFYGSILSEFLRIARNTLLLEEFVPKSKDLFLRMCKQGGEKKKIIKQIEKAFNRHQQPFSKFNKHITNIIKAVVE